MTLEKLIKLKPGDTFYYKGNSAQVKWRERNEDFLYSEKKDGQEINIYWKYFGLCFVSKNKTYTFSSYWPHENLDLEDFQP